MPSNNVQPAGQALNPQMFRGLIKERGWGELHLRLNSKKVTSETVHMVLKEPGQVPTWFGKADDVPHFLDGESFHEVNWDVDDAVVKDHPPNLVLTAGSTGKSDVAKLVSRCREDKKALQAYCSISTPSLEWKVLLVPSHIQEAPSSSAAKPSKPHTPSASSNGASAPEFHAYFLPCDSKTLEAINSTTPAAKDSLNRTWLRQLLAASSGSGRAEDETYNTLIGRWREERQQLDADPATGMPSAEPNVYYRGYWERTQACFGDDVSIGPTPHVSSVKSVMPGCHFTYSTRPWRSDGKGGLTPMEEDADEHFVSKCGCARASCEGSSGREALRKLRTEGTPFPMEIRQSGADRGLGVFALVDIPSEAYVIEYTGIYMGSAEADTREFGTKAGAAGYYDANLYYTFDNMQKRRRSTSKGESQAELCVTDATHFGNASRFINHHCKPNLKVVNVCAGLKSEARHKFLLFKAVRKIKRGEELTINYRGGLESFDTGVVACKCGEEQCVKWLFPKPSNSVERQQSRAASAPEGDVDRPVATPPAEIVRGGKAAVVGADKEETATDKEETATDEEETATDKEGTATDEGSADEGSTDEEETATDEGSADEEETATDEGSADEEEKEAADVLLQLTRAAAETPKPAGRGRARVAAGGDAHAADAKGQAGARTGGRASKEKGAGSEKAGARGPGAKGQGERTQPPVVSTPTGIKARLRSAGSPAAGAESDSVATVAVNGVSGGVGSSNGVKKGAAKATAAPGEAPGAPRKAKKGVVE